MTPLPRGLHETREFDHGAGCLEYGIAVRFRRCRQSYRRGGAGRVGHLACERTLPDQRVQLELVGRHFGRDFLGIAELRARRSDAFVGFLRSGGFRRVLLGRVGQVSFAEILHDRIACGGDRLLRKRHRIGTHVGDVAVLVQSLRGAHGLPRAHAEAISGGLLQCGRGKRWNRTTAVRLGFHRIDGKRGKFEGACDCAGLRPVHLHDVVFRAGGGQSAVRAEILGRRQPATAQGDHARIEGDILSVRTGSLQRGGDVPIRGTDERHALALALDDQSGGDGLHTARGKSRTDLAPQHRRKLIAVQTVQNTARLLGVHHGAVHIARIVQRVFDGFRRDFVEHHALDRHLGLERLHQMPCDGLTLAILIGCEIQGVGFLQRALELGNGFLLVSVNDVIRFEPVFDVNAELAELGFVRCGNLTGLRKVTNMADRCLDRIVGAQISADFLGFGGRLHNNELAAGSHGHSLLLAFATQY